MFPGAIDVGVRPADRRRGPATARLRCATTTLLVWLIAAASGAQPADVTALSRAAAQAMTERRFDQAAVLYGYLLKALPDDPGVLMSLGMALVRGRHPKEAVAPLERAVALDPKLIAADALLGSSYLALAQPGKAVGSLERVVAARPADVESRRMLAEAYAGSGRRLDALLALRKVTTLAPKLPSGWYELGQAYNALAQEAMSTFGDQPDDAPWRELLLADALLVRGPLADAFVLYRRTLDRLPAMVSIHDSVAQIYDKTEHPDWAARERTGSRLTPGVCLERKALCAFRAGRYSAALDAALAQSDRESRYWRVRAASALALAAFAKLDTLPDAPERRAIRATHAMAEERYTDAVAELKAALTLSPGVPALVFELASSYYAARDYEQALATLAPLLQAAPDEDRLLALAGHSLLQLRRPEEAVPLLQRVLAHAPDDPAVRSALGRAHVQKGDFAAAVPLLEAQLASDQDGSLHVQLARAYTGLGRREEAAALLTRSQEIQRAAEDRQKAAAERTITPPK